MVEDEQWCTARNKQKRTEFIFQVLRISLYFAKNCFWNNVYSKKRGVDKHLSRPSFFRSQFEVQTDFLTFSP